MHLLTISVESQLFYTLFPCWSWKSWDSPVPGWRLSESSRAEEEAWWYSPGVFQLTCFGHVDSFSYTGETLISPLHTHLPSMWLFFQKQWKYWDSCCSVTLNTCLLLTGHSHSLSKANVLSLHIHFHPGFWMLSYSLSLESGNGFWNALLTTKVFPLT